MSFGPFVTVKLIFALILSVTAAPPLAKITHGNDNGNSASLSKNQNQPKVQFQILTGIEIEPSIQTKTSEDAELQLEHLKLNSNSNIASTISTATFSTSKPKLDLNLETPAVSDNSHPEPPSQSQESIKQFSFSKIFDLDKKKESRLTASSISKGIDQGKHSNFNKLRIESTDYTAQDIAEYIFWTGDQRGVIEALNDFLQDDIIGKENVIKFLGNIRIELKLLQNRFDSAVSNSRSNPSQGQEFIEQKGFFNDQEKRIHDTSPVLAFPTTKDAEEEVDYEEFVQNMNGINVKLREDSLREIIYRLAKEIFSERFGEHAIQRFVHFVEDAATSGHIPRDLEKEVLDTMVSALVDTMFERDMMKNQNKLSDVNPKKENSMESARQTDLTLKR